MPPESDAVSVQRRGLLRDPRSPRIEQLSCALAYKVASQPFCYLEAIIKEK